jgi:hypothetical protein
MEKEQVKRIIRVLHAEPEKGAAVDLEGLQDALRTFRTSAHTAAERSNSFWVKQRADIAARLQQPVERINRPAIAWISAVIIALLCLSMFINKPDLPAAEFAGGSDQQLLIEVERALSRKCPEALAPASAISQEIENYDRNGRK